MIKINNFKLITVLKSFQIAFILIIFAFLLTLFITSLFAINQFKISLINPNYKQNLLVGLIVLDWSNGFHVYLSTYTICYLVIITFFLILFIINALYLKIKFFYINNYFWFYSIFFCCSLILFLLICLLSFINLNFNSLNICVDKPLNCLIDYSIKTYNVSTNDLLFSVNLSTGGIIFSVFGSLAITGLFYFPFKIIYNLVKIKYV